MRRLAPLAILAAIMFAAASANAGPFTPTATPTYNGTRAVVDLPTSQHMRNVGGSDGLGLCVFTSLEHSARWANLIDMVGYRKWMELQPGGGYPSKVDKTLADYCRSKGIAVPSYIQHTGGDDAVLTLALRTGRFPCVTYDGRDGFYRGSVAHMVNLAHLDESKAAIIDNNRPGQWVWMSRADFLSRWRGTDGGWAVVFLGPPPTPYNAKPVESWKAEAECICGDECKCKRGDCPGKCPLIYGQCPGGRCPAPLASNPQASRLMDWPAARRQCLDTRESGVVFVGIDPASVGMEERGPAAFVQPGEGWTVGVWDYWYSAGQVWAQQREVINVPASGMPVAEVEPPTGVDRSRIHEAPTYAKDGRPCTREEAHSALLQDDSDRWHLAAVGDAEFIGKVKADVSKLPEEVRSKMHAQYYTPSAWQVEQFKLQPGVTLRKPAAGRISADAGTVPAAEYTAEKFAQLCPKSKPSPSPTPSKPNDPTPGPPDPKPAYPLSPWTWLAFGAGAWLIWKNRTPK